MRALVVPPRVREGRLQQCLPSPGFTAREEAVTQGGVALLARLARPHTHTHTGPPHSPPYLQPLPRALSILSLAHTGHCIISMYPSSPSPPYTFTSGHYSHTLVVLTILYLFCPTITHYSQYHTFLFVSELRTSLTLRFSLS